MIEEIKAIRRSFSLRAFASETRRPFPRTCYSNILWSASQNRLRHDWLSADIVSACFALPFERRLILGTEDGKLLLVNYVTGAILDELQPHTAEVVCLPDQCTAW